jgi:hypothetical protein
MMIERLRTEDFMLLPLGFTDCRRRCIDATTPAAKPALSAIPKNDDLPPTPKKAPRKGITQQNVSAEGFVSVVLVAIEKSTIATE